MKSGLLYLSYLAVTLITGSLTGCQHQPPEIQPTASLPPPRILVTHAPTASVTPQKQSVLPAADSQVIESASPESLADAAQSVHGNRLVEWIEIPALNILAPVEPVGWQPVADALDENTAVVWDSPDAAVGWVVSSALPGDADNILLYGHNNLHASVFLKLSELKPGDKIMLRTGEEEWTYSVQETRILPVMTSDQDFAAYQEYFQPTSSARLTLLSCWPPVSNTHRVVVIAIPAGE